MTREYVLYGALVLAGFALGVLGMVGVERALAPGAEEVEIPVKEQVPVTHAATSTTSWSEPAVQVGTQVAGLTVRATEVSLPADGWLVVHEVDNGHVGNALGAARRDVGQYAEVDIELLRATEPGKEYMLILYADDADKVFELKTDIPIVDTQGDPAMKLFTTLP